jgi:hypothetical protein
MPGPEPVINVLTGKARNQSARPGISLGPLLLLALLCMACLLPFADKAFHIDDPLFVWAARHIQQHPEDFYEFSVNWYFEEKPMSEVTKNPPLACYYLALAGSLFGWSELALHVACLLPAVGMVWGTYRLAQEFCTRPLLAALAAMLTPAFLVSSSTVMCDTMLGCFWIWALVFWERGLRRADVVSFLISGLLIAASALTKYFGISLVPLLLVYTLADRRKLGLWLLVLCIPIIVLGGYQWLTHIWYGQDLLREAAGYATRVQANSAARITIGDKLLIGLAFMGGSIAGMLFYFPVLAPRRFYVPAFGLVAVLSWLFYLSGSLGPFLLVVKAQPRWEVIVPEAIFCAAGIGLLLLSLLDLQAHRDAKSLLLALWIAGTFVFTALVNWSINARSVLPLVPAAGILLMRTVERLRGPAGRNIEWSLLGPLLPAGALALLVTLADYRLANSARTAAHRVYEMPGRSGSVWFQGHWGFQYYMQELGARCLDISDMHCVQGDWIVQPDDNYGTFAMPAQSACELETISEPTFPWLTTMHRLMGAGFYSNRKGPLPYAFGKVSDNEYRVLEVIQPVNGRLLLMGDW